MTCTGNNGGQWGVYSNMVEKSRSGVVAGVRVIDLYIHSWRIEKKPGNTLCIITITTTQPHIHHYTTTIHPPHNRHDTATTTAPHI